MELLCIVHESGQNLLRHVLASEPAQAFQDWQPWRRLVVAAATQILDCVGGVLLIPQSVLVHRYWQEIRAGLTDAGIPICHVVLHADRDEFIRRIDTDPAMPHSQWRFDHHDDYEAARPWHSREAHVIDTTGPTPHRVTRIVAVQAERTGPPTTDRDRAG